LRKLIHLLVLLLTLSVLGCGETNNDVNVNVPPPSGSPVNPIARLEFYALGANLNGGGINAFRVESQTGTLTPVAGQPFAPGASFFSVAFSRPGRFVYGIDTVTNNISGFRLEPTTGVLTALPGFPVASVSNASVFLDLDGDEMYLPGLTSIDGFRIDQATGAITRMAGFPLTVPGMVDAQIGHFAPNGFFYVADRGSNQIFSFSHNEATGALTLVGTTPTGSSQPLGLEADETGRFLYCNHTDGTLQGFSLGANGALTRVTPTAVTYGGPNQVSWEFTCKDRILYIGDNVGNNLNAFSISSTGALTPVAGYPVAGTGGAAVMSFRNPLLPYIYISRAVASQINAFRVDTNGNRSSVPGAPFQAGSRVTDLVPVEVTF